MVGHKRTTKGTKKKEEKSDVFDVDAFVRRIAHAVGAWLYGAYDAYCDVWYDWLDTLPEAFVQEHTMGIAGTKFGFVSRHGAVYPAVASRVVGGEHKTKRALKPITWKVQDAPVLAARGHDPDPNRGEYFFDYKGISLVGAVVIEQGVLLVYQAPETSQRIYIGAALVRFDSVHSVWHMQWRCEVPLASITVPLRAVPYSITRDGSWLRLQWHTRDTAYTYTIHNPFADLYEHNTPFVRASQNPIIRPNPERAWEAVATFNPAAVLIGDTVHLLYRAFGHEGRSVVGHAISKNGIDFLRASEPAYVARSKEEGIGVPMEEKNSLYRSPARYGVDGAEDPRATVIDGRVYMIYAAFNGWQQARTAGTSITENDFVRGNYHRWDEPVMLTPPPTHWGTGGKNGALFPQKINGTYAIMYRTWPHIHIDYTSEPQFNEYRTQLDKRFLQPKATITIRPAFWDSGKIAVGPPPIEIDEGWLVLYVGVSQQAHDGYKVGAMILDRHHPEKVLYRTTRPVLSPNTWYEREGLVANITYPCGAVVKDDTLCVYYGAADTYVAVVTASLRAFIEAVKADSVPDCQLEKAPIHDTL
jgi:predicted GH43/DUF377 family glycosyl hydrolase